MRGHVVAIVSHVQNAGWLSRFTNVKVGFLRFRTMYGGLQLQHSFRAQYGYCKNAAKVQVYCLVSSFTPGTDVGYILSPSRVVGTWWSSNGKLAIEPPNLLAG